jgi:hypothetical protein
MITEKRENDGESLIPQFCIPFGMHFVLLIEEKLRMTAHLKIFFQSREEHVLMGLFPGVFQYSGVFDGSCADNCSSVILAPTMEV